MSAADLHPIGGGNWGEVIDQVDEKHDRAHDRIRGDLQTVVSTVTSLNATLDRNYRYFEDQNAAMRLRVNTIEQLAGVPMDARKLVLPTPAIVAILGAVVGATITIGASYWSLSGKMDAQQQQTVATAKLQEIQMKTLSDAAADAKATAADAKRQYELLRYDNQREFQALRDAIAGKGKS